MAHQEEHTSAPSKGFGINTNGFGILLVVIVAVSLVLFCWNFWKDGSREAELYRFNTEAPASAEGSEHAEKTEEAPVKSEGAAAGIAIDSISKTSATDTTKPAANSTKTAADTTAH
jgi:hypothetical protein